MHQKLSVLHLFNGATGGAAMSTIALIKQLKVLGISSCAICDDMGTPEERARISDAVDGKARFAPLYWWNRKIRAARWKRPLLEVRQLLRTGFRRRSTNTVLEGIDRWQPTLVHTNTLLTPEGAMAAKKRGIAHVWHVRELVGKTAPFQLPLAEHALGSYLAKAADRVIANSYITAACLSPYMPADSLTVIPNGIDCSAFRNQPDKEWTEPIVVALVGNLSSRLKKHHLLIEAAAKVDPKLKIEWRIYGHDPSEGGLVHTDQYMNSLRALSRELHVEGKLKFPGHCPPQQIMQEIDILLHPADAESFGRVLVEAMAACKPVVSVNAGGASELIDHEQNGLLAAPDDSHGLAKCVERLIHDADLRTRLAKAGRVRVERDYTIEVHTQRVAAVYEEVMQNHGKWQAAHSR